MKPVQRILAVHPVTHGFGFAVLEAGQLVDWGLKVVAGERPELAVAKVRDLIRVYLPTLLVLEDPASVSRAPRMRTLHQALLVLGKAESVRVRCLAREKVHGTLLHAEATKHEIAVLMAERFPEELGSRLPSKRRPWQSEDSRMSIFAAVALAVAVSAKKSHEI